MKRTVIKIDNDACNGCGNCVTGCHEGALQLIDGKAVMISDLYCDGLGACVGECPVGAITFEEREAIPYDESAVMERLSQNGRAAITAHLLHLASHNQRHWLIEAVEYIQRNNIVVDLKSIEFAGTDGIQTNLKAFLSSEPTLDKDSSPASFLNNTDFQKIKFGNNIPTTDDGKFSLNPLAKHQSHDRPYANGTTMACGCPSAMAREIKRPAVTSTKADGIAPTATGRISNEINTSQPSELRQFPVQLHLINPHAPFFKGADLLLAADCTAFSCGDFHSRFLKGKMLAVACPKLDNSTEIYIEKLSDMITVAGIRSLTVVVMEVPCCSGLVQIARQARQAAAGRCGSPTDLPLRTVTLSVSGEVLDDVLT